MAYGQDDRHWQGHMLPGERLVWQGRPRLVFRLDRTAMMFAMPAFLVASGYLLLPNIFQVASDSRFSPVGPSLDQQVTWACIAVLVYLALYLSWHSLKATGLNRYALTNKRVLVHSVLPWRKVYAKHLTPLSEIEWDGSSPGTITFDEMLKNYGQQPGRGWFSQSVVRTERIGFQHIDEADKVFALMERVKEGKA